MHKKVLGSVEGDNADEFFQLEHIPIERSEIHPRYNPETIEYDFLVIKLKWASKLYAHEIVALDTPFDGFEPNSGDDLTIMGFGRLSSNLPSPNVMHEVTLKYVTTSDCTSVYKYPPGRITDSMLCAGTIDGEGTCSVSLFNFSSPKLKLLFI